MKKNSLITKARILNIYPSVTELSYARKFEQQKSDSEQENDLKESIKLIANITMGKKIDSYGQFPWFDDALRIPSLPMSPAKFNLNRNNSISNKITKGWWTHPYYLCEDESWLISYISPIIKERKLNKGKQGHN